MLPTTRNTHVNIIVNYLVFWRHRRTLMRFSQPLTNKISNETSVIQLPRTSPVAQLRETCEYNNRLLAHLQLPPLM